ncbi:hypothetical protein CPB84DRAFT_1782588 [Gymnopilus junonius]|uniref:Uncharacterized protein n=1 Tax=Gymnopilus junonius TaxID=109634 RepID=A0A9P5TLQ1_GYMJU|nr:hypothetical protein CPB84DRAFT_1782588 [Gymnopilus junonius]
MGFSLGAVGLSSFRNPFADFLAKGDLRSMFCLIVFLIVSLVLAYLTNPSENSFRAYLTEQSFRLHLSRLDENAEDPHAHSHFHSSYHARDNPSSSSSPPFHFANRASIALRTPKHVFHSFAIFTIAAMVPLSKASDGDNHEGWMISDSWYIGAFGKWWRGGVLEAWYQDVIARSKDEESWSSGILSMKRLDMLQEYNGPTFSAKNLPSHLMRGSPPRLRNRERPASRHTSVQPRSSTPPPLPKTASLPMHTTRKSSNNDRICERTAQMQSQSHMSSCLPLAPSRSPSTLFEQSPLIADVLRQITSTKTSVLDLRTQLSECESAASQSRALLQNEVETHRDRKRQEDTSKLELKARTKSLEDSKRGAESTKKEVEKKLKAAQLCRDGATQRMEFLDKEIMGLQQKLSEDREFILNHRGHISEEERNMTRNLEEKRQQIKVSEDLLLDLNQRSRELEDRLASEKERLRVLRAETDKLKQNRAVRYPSPEESWPYTGGSHISSNHVVIQNGDGWGPSLLTLASRQSSGSYHALPDDRVTLAAPIAGSLSGGVVPHGQHTAIPSQLLPRLSHGMGYPGHPVSDRTVFESGEAAHLQLTKAADYSLDAFIDREWHRPPVPYANHYQSDEATSGFPTVTSSPTSYGTESGSFNSPFDFDFVPDGQTFAPSQVQQSWGPANPERAFVLDRNSSEPSSRTNGWRTSTKGLNPDAKEFNLFRKPPAAFSNEPPRRLQSASSKGGYDALNPNGLGTMTSSTSSTNQSLLRAFAPSPAEREALQRALGGSSNTSFERLPSLSDVGSIPASPTHIHALPRIPHHPSGRDLGSILPVWLQALPRTRKVNFSPWEDEEPSTTMESTGRRS